MKSTESNMYLPKTSLWLLIIVGLLTFISISGYAQDTKKVKLGLTASPSFTWLTPDNKGYENNGLRMGFKYGLTGDFSIFQSNNYFLYTGFTINSMGGKLSNPDVISIDTILTATKEESTYKLRYIDVPLAIKLKTNEIGYLTYYGVFGSEIGFNIRAKKDYKNSHNQSEDDVDIKEDVNFMKASLLIGGGVEYNISGNTMIVAGLTFSNGLTNILKGNALLNDNGVATIEDNASIEDKKLKTRSNFLMVNIAVLF